MEWQPIETAPKGREIILYYPAITNASHPSNNKPAWIVVSHTGYHRRQATHWMPLPKPPVV